MLLNAYAFATMGTIALYAAIASFAGAAMMIVLSVLGLVHGKQTDEAVVLGRKAASRPAAAVA